MDDIKNRLGLWCSIGISENKFLSKMASDMKKPLGITELWKSDIKDKLWPLPVRAMYGIGSKTSEKLNSMGINTIGELAKFDRNYLIKVFGKYAFDLHQQANGEDSSRVQTHSSDVKSIGRSTTLPEDIADINKLKIILMELAEDVGMKAREQAKKGTTIQITLKYASFQSVTRQTTVAPTYSTKTIYQTGYELLRRNFSSNRPIRLIGISLSGFEEAAIHEQISIFEETQNNKHEKIDEVMDRTRKKHGFEKINRGSLIKK
ncbi:Y-family DNA polymerase [Alkaliphilus serpentinus]|uniref:Y-family DNA polymerase n=1 Tax=Alkaliphilus serpentinus TaxID=1482731 RepID=UPI002ED1FB5F